MEIDEDLKAFLVESTENINQIEADLVALETHPTDPELMTRIYRNFHTLKGNGGFLGLNALETITHAAENLLSCLRQGQLALTPEITTGLLQVIDAVRTMLTALETTGETGEADFTDLTDTLAQLQIPDDQGAAAKSPSPSPAEPVSPAIAVLHTSIIADSAIRVDVTLLDNLMNLVGELVLCRNQILEFANTQSDTYLTDTSQRLNLVTTELQEGVMKTRMQPIRQLWSKFPRVVRDLSRSVNKQVRLVMEGEDTELDKTLLEAISDPLTHIVRNCIDHGIEPPAQRTEGGKPPEGQLCLRAVHESGYVNIEISDDGAGINPERLRQKAIASGLLKPEQANRMSDLEALNLIFLPGLSTAEQVTNLSGRGIGMDVVRTNLEKIGGAIDVQSRLGEGTSFRLKIPLTLAIVPTLIVTCGGERYAIPQVNLLELVRLEGEHALKGVEMVHGAPVYRLRGSLLPLVYLTDELKLKPSASGNQGLSSADDDSLNIVVLQAVDKSFGLVVDSINDTQEIVVKPLGKQLKGISCFAGATIMGDGRVALILDIQGLAQRAHMVSEAEEAALTVDLDKSIDPTADPTQTLLLFQGPDNRRMAISLHGVARLEQFSRNVVERVGHQDVIQYRNQILPLIYLSAVFGQGGSPRRTGASDDLLQVVVAAPTHDQNSQDNNKTLVGLVVENIQDIIDESIRIRGPATQPGVEYSAVVQGKVTEILDIAAIAHTVQFAAQPAIAR